MPQFAVDSHKTVADGPLTVRQLFTSQVAGRSLAVLVVLAYRGLFRPMGRVAA
jgi:hypothetical protein